MSSNGSENNSNQLPYGVKLLSTVSTLTSFSMGIIITYSISSLSLFNQDIAWLATLRVYGEICGYFARILAGFITDRSRENLYGLLLVGYSAPIIFKIMLLISMTDILPINTRCILFGLANVLDKIFNVWRDIPRDVAVVELTPPHQLRKNIAFRKLMGNIGTATGGLLAIGFNYLANIAPSFVPYKIPLLYLLAFMPSLLSSYLLYKNRSIYADIIIRNKEIQSNSKYDIYDNFWKFSLVVGTVIILFSGRVNEMYIFNLVRSKNYNVELLYVIFYFLAPLSLGITYYNSKIGSLDLLLSSVITVGATVIIFKAYLNGITTLLVCLGYSFYNSMLDTVLFSTVIRRFNQAKYNAILLAIINISMGVGTIISMKLIDFSRSINTGPLSLFYSLLPIAIGISLLLIFRDDFKPQENSQKNT